MASSLNRLVRENDNLRTRLAAVEAVVSAARAWAEKYDKPNRRPSGAEGMAIIRAVRALAAAQGVARDH